MVLRRPACCRSRRSTAIGPRMPWPRLVFRNPDAIDQPSRALADLVPGFQKVGGARRMAQLLGRENRSSEFPSFVGGRGGSGEEPAEQTAEQLIRTGTEISLAELGGERQVAGDPDRRAEALEVHDLLARLSPQGLMVNHGYETFPSITGRPNKEQKSQWTDNRRTTRQPIEAQWIQRLPIVS